MFIDSQVFDQFVVTHPIQTCRFGVHNCNQLLHLQRVLAKKPTYKITMLLFQKCTSIHQIQIIQYKIMCKEKEAMSLNLFLYSRTDANGSFRTCYIQQTPTTPVAKVSKLGLFIYIQDYKYHGTICIEIRLYLKFQIISLYKQVLQGKLLLEKVKIPRVTSFQHVIS